MAEHFLDVLGIKPDNVEALRSLTRQQLVKTADEVLTRAQTTAREIGGMPFQPVIDGSTLPQRPLAAVRDGAAKGIPILVGSTLDEWKLFGALDPRITKSDQDQDRQTPGAASARC